MILWYSDPKIYHLKPSLLDHLLYWALAFIVMLVVMAMTMTMTMTMVDFQEDFIPPPPMDETASEKMDRISATIKLSRNEISEIM